MSKRDLPPLPDMMLSGGVDPNMLHPVSDVLAVGDAPPAGPEPDAAPAAENTALTEEASGKLIAARDRQWQERMRARDHEANREAVDAALQVHLGDLAIPANSVGEAQFRSQIQGLRVDLREAFGKDVNGQRKDRAWYLGRAAEFAKSRTEQVLADNTDGADHLPSMRGSGDRPADLFSAGAVLKRLTEYARGGYIPPLERLDGITEMEVIQELAKREDVKRYSAMLPRGTNSLHIPIPLAAIERDAALAMLHRFAETYGTDAGTRREPTFRVDELIGIFRPTNNGAFLGVRDPIIANDVTIPTVTASLAAVWMVEQGLLQAQDITTTVERTSPKRIGVRDDLSWMLLAAADQQFGHVPYVISEMYAAVDQKKEEAIYIGTGSGGQPQGVWGVTGVHSPTVTAPASYGELLEFLKVIAEENIDVTMARFATTWPMMIKLAQTLNFSATGVVTSAARPLFEESRDDFPMGAGRGRIIGFPSAITTQMPSAATSATALTGGALSTVLFGLWRYYFAPRYSMAFLTIDDVSQAANATTRLTLNEFCDGRPLLPTAFARGVWNPAT